MLPKPSVVSPVPIALMAALAAATVGCGASGDAGGASRAPAKSGDVWVIANPDDGRAAPGAVLAYVNGLHTFVLDGNDAYLGMTRVSARTGENGARVIALAAAGDVQILPVGDSLELRFPGGETVPLRKQRSLTR